MTQPELSTATLSSQPTYTPASITQHCTTPLEDISEIYEVDRTVSYILSNRYRQIALQFPDELLPVSTRVLGLLKHGIENGQREPTDAFIAEKLEDLTVAETTSSTTTHQINDVRLYILADTSYGSCCVDEIAAEHADADCVIHYGRACLSPTSRLPVLHVFTTRALPLNPVVNEFKKAFQDVDEKIVLMSSLPYITQLPALTIALQAEGYKNLFTTEVVHNPASPIPNRTAPTTDVEELHNYHLFHIDQPLTSLILTLSTRTASLHVYNTADQTSEPIESMPMLRRRYALLSHIRSAGIVGILVNTLSATNYMPVISSLKKLFKQHGKKSYLFVVGKVNAAKVANFSEVECWVVVGCWESSVLDEGREFWRACVTPWEAKTALEGGEGAGVQGWRTDFEGFLGTNEAHRIDAEAHTGQTEDGDAKEDEGDNIEQDISDDESAPPVFDLRTGRYISSSTPLHPTQSHIKSRNSRALEHNFADVKTLTTTSKNKTLTMINNTISPGAAYLQEKRQWTGLGSDYNEVEIDAQGAMVEEGRAGVARRYKVGDGVRS